ncbi:MAG: phosphoribosyltransferase family protein [Pseudomonadales bacterium]
MAAKQYIDAQQLLDDSYRLGLQILESGYLPNFIIGIWRGGAPVGIAIHELLDYFGVTTDHIAIRTSLYSGIEQRAGEVRVHGLGYVLDLIKGNDAVLIVDDVYDTGLSVQQVLKNIRLERGEDMPEIRVATPYFKPNNNKTDRAPDYYLHETDDWLVFPHELSGLSAREMLDNKPGIDCLREKLTALAKDQA